MPIPFGSQHKFTIERDGGCTDESGDFTPAGPNEWYICNLIVHESVILNGKKSFPRAVREVWFFRGPKRRAPSSGGPPFFHVRRQSIAAVLFLWWVIPVPTAARKWQGQRW